MFCTPKNPTALDFLTHFQAVEDPRQEGKILYPLEEILLLVLCGVISGGDGWVSIALYGQKKLELLRRFLPFENGTPSHDQLGILFSRLDIDLFQSCFLHSIPARVWPPSTWFQLGPVTKNSFSDNAKSMTNPMRSRPSRNCWNC